MKIVKNGQNAYIIDDIILKSKAVDLEEKIKEKIADKLEIIAESYGWGYNRENQIFFCSDGNGGEIPKLVLFPNRAFIFGETGTQDYKCAVHLVGLLYVDENWQKGGVKNEN